MHIHSRLHIGFLCPWSINQSSGNDAFHEWDANKIKRRECICTNESSRSKYNASQLLPSFFNCTGTSASLALSFPVRLLLHTFILIFRRMSLYLCITMFHLVSYRESWVNIDKQLWCDMLFVIITVTIILCIYCLKH